jgi:hypothetical protein
MALSQPAQRDEPATIGDKRSRQVVLELSRGEFSSKNLIEMPVSPGEASCGFGPAEDQSCGDAGQLLSLWGQDTFTITTEESSDRG